jgi:hypothetical protein
MSDIELPKRTAEDPVHRTAKAGLSAIPLAGGPAAEFFDYFVTSPISKRKDEFIYNLALGLERLQKNQIDIETLPNNQRFVTIVNFEKVQILFGLFLAGRLLMSPLRIIGIIIPRFLSYVIPLASRFLSAETLGRDLCTKNVCYISCKRLMVEEISR